VSNNATGTPKPLVLKIVPTSQEHIEPVNLAIKQIEAVFEWMNIPENRHLAEKEAVRTACASFHPDWRYDPQTRELRDLNHLGQLWARWECLEFSPDDETHTWFIRCAEVKGYLNWHEMGTDDFRKAALHITAQLAAYEGSRLLDAVAAKPPSLPEIWRRLYWFTRFFRAMQRIGFGITPGQWVGRQKAATKTREWKRDAWAFLKKREALYAREHGNARVSKGQAARDFVEKCSPGVTAKHVQDYFTERSKKSVGRARTDKRK